MILAMLVGCGVGFGFYVLWTAARPLPPNLAGAIHAMLSGDAFTPLSRAQGERRSTVTRRLETRMRPVTLEVVDGLGYGNPSLTLQRNLRILGRTVEGFVFDKILLAVAFPIVCLLVAMACALAGLSPSMTLMFSLSALSSVGGFFLPNVLLRSEAEERRHEFRHTLSAFLDLISVSLAGGAHEVRAIRDAAAIGHGWAFDEIRRLLKGRPGIPWEDFEEFGHAIGATELVELSRSLSSAGAEGTRIRESLTARAESLRVRRISEAEATAGEVGERMALPLALFGLAFLAFIGFPAVWRLLTAA